MLGRRSIVLVGLLPLSLAECSLDWSRTQPGATSDSGTTGGSAGSGGSSGADASSDAMDADATGGGGGSDASADQAGETGTDADADASNTGCPIEMARIVFGSADFCIDGAEATVESYAAFLAALPGLDAGVIGHPRCGWKSSGQYAPLDYSTQQASPKLPVVGVDWCMAHAFCAQQGKRLCGAVGGGGLDSGVADKSGEWYLACSNNGVQSYPYGFSHTATCNDCSGDAGGCQLKAASTGGNCKNSGANVVDMSGNAGEWTNSCQIGSNAELDECDVRGGDFGTTSPSCLTCSHSCNQNLARNVQSKKVGIRCCKDPEP